VAPFRGTGREEKGAGLGKRQQCIWASAKAKGPVQHAVQSELKAWISSLLSSSAYLYHFRFGLKITFPEKSLFFVPKW